MKLAGERIDLLHMMLARMIDELSFLSWSKTKDGAKNRNRPQSVIKLLTEKKVEEFSVYHTAEDFMTMWDMIARRNENA